MTSKRLSGGAVILAASLVFGTVLAVAAGVAITSVSAAWIAPAGEVAAAPPVRSRPEPTVAAVGKPRPVVDRITRSEFVDAVLARNIFDHTAVGVEAEEGAGEEGGLTDLDLVLLATLVASPREMSSALIRPGDTNAAAWAYGIGDELMDATIVDIEPERISLRRADGTLEYLQAELEREEGGARRSVNLSEADAAINEVGERHFEVDRALIDGLMADPSALGKLGRAAPYKKNGEFIGFRVSGIRKDSLGRKIGLTTGDVITKVNDTPLTSTQAAMGLMGQLNRSNTFQVEVRRRGQYRTITVDLK